MLNKALFQKKLADFFKKNRKSPDEAAKDLAEIIDSYIRSMTIIVDAQGMMPPGTIVVAGSPATQTNPAPIITTVQGKGQVT